MSDHRRSGAWAPRHHSWRRWRITDRLTRWCYLLGIAKSGRYCADQTGAWNGARWRDFRWGRRPYVLGWPTEKWRCLLRYHHWPYWPDGHPVFMGACGRCLPWPCCNSIETGHAASCPDYTTDGLRRCTARWWAMTTDPFAQRRQEWWRGAQVPMRRWSLMRHRLARRPRHPRRRRRSRYQLLASAAGSRAGGSGPGWRPRQRG